MCTAEEKYQQLQGKDPWTKRGRPPKDSCPRSVTVMLSEDARRWIASRREVKTPYGVAYLSIHSIVSAMVDRAAREDQPLFELVPATKGARK